MGVAGRPLRSHSWFKRIDHSGFEHRARLKARGGMARFAIENRLEKVEDLKAFDRDGYRFDKTLSTDTDWIFIREGNS